VNYTVRVADWVREFVDNLPRTIAPRVRQRLLHDLPADPERELGEVVVPRADHFTFYVSGIDNQQNPPVGFWYVFVVRRTGNELHVVSVRPGDRPQRN
jgi:hypothetical protein